MKIYLAGNNAMEKDHRQKLYSRFLKGRLFSYYEICPPDGPANNGDGSVRIYLATWLLEQQQGVVLTKKSAMSRLVSYYHTREKAKEFPEYLRTGQVIKK